MTKETEDKARLDGRFIKVHRPFILDVQEGRYTPNDLLFFSAIKMVATTIHMTDMAVTSVDILLELTGFARKDRNRKMVIESLNSLAEGNLIKVYCDISLQDENKDIKNSDVLYIEITEKVNDKESFTQLRHFEFNDIVHSGERNPAKMLLLYCTITVDVFEKSELKQTNISNEKLSTKCGIDKKTVTKYIQKLEEIKVLYRKYVQFKDEDGAIKTKNVFTRYDWRDFIESRYM